MRDRAERRRFQLEATNRGLAGGEPYRELHRMLTDEIADFTDQIDRL